MILYNPFKPHIVEDSGVFYIRRLGFLFFWNYLDSDENYWWFSLENGCEFCSYENFVSARLRLIEMQVAKKISKKPKVKHKFTAQ